MRLLPLPSPHKPPLATTQRHGFRAASETPKKVSDKVHLLLAGGTDPEFRALVEKLRPYKIVLGWHWPRASASSRRDFPKCDAVLLCTDSIEHSLSWSVTDLAKKAGVPVIPHNSWPRTLAALAAAHIGHHPEVSVSEEPKKNPVPTGLKIPVPTDDVIVETHTSWQALSPELQAGVRSAAIEADENTRTPLPPEVRDVLRRHDGNPRAFIALVVLATADRHVTQAAVQRLCVASTGKKLESDLIKTIAGKVASWCGPQHGIRKGDAFDLRKLHPPRVPLNLEAVEVNPTPAPPAPVVQESPVPVPTPPPASRPVQNWAKSHYLRLLDAAVEGGEKMTVQKIQSDYVITYEDGTTVRVEPPKPS